MSQLHDKIDLNIDNYDTNELLEILNINTLNKQDIIEASSKLINKFTQENNTKLVEFFKQVQERLLNSQDKTNIMNSVISDNKDIVNNNNKYNLQNQDDKHLSNLWSNQYLVQSDSNQEQRNTERKQTVELFDSEHNVMYQQRLGINQTYNLPLAQGQMNPNLKNINTRLVNIDSKFRQFSFPAKNGLSFSQITTPHLSTYSNTDFYANLTDTLHNVISLKLYSISIPFTWYNIDMSNSNNCFIIIIDNISYKIEILSGNYMAETEIIDSPNNIYFAINNAINNAIPQYSITFSYDILTGKTKIESDTDIKIIWYALPSEIKEIAPLYDGNGIGNKANYNLGFILGFRDVNLNIQSNETIISDSLINLFGPKYLLLVLDDYNQNHLNKGLISIQANDTIATMPDYYDPNIPYVNENEGGNNVYGIVDEPRDFQNKNIIYKQLTNAQQTTINGIAYDRANKINNKIKSATNSDIFAVIPITKDIDTVSGQVLTETRGLQINERVYFGPVDIDKFHIKLLTDLGEPLNLNGIDWSFCMIVESLYQY